MLQRSKLRSKSQTSPRKSGLLVPARSTRASLFLYVTHLFTSLRCRFFTLNRRRTCWECSFKTLAQSQHLLRHLLRSWQPKTITFWIRTLYRSVLWTGHGRHPLLRTVVLELVSILPSTRMWLMVAMLTMVIKRRLARSHLCLRENLCCRRSFHHYGVPRLYFLKVQKKFRDVSLLSVTDGMVCSGFSNVAGNSRLVVRWSIWSDLIRQLSKIYYMDSVCRFCREMGR